jgi:hypothetical protein
MRHTVQRVPGACDGICGRSAGMRFLALLLACSLLAAVEPVPTPLSPVAQRALDLTLKHQQFFDWALVDPFRRGGGQEPWRADAERLLVDLARLIAANEADPHLPELTAAGRALVGAGCDDPLVQVRVGILLGGGDGSKLIRDSIAPLRTHAPGYPGLHLVSALRRQVEPRSRKLTAEAVRDLPDLIVTASREALAAPCGRAIAVDRLIDWFAPLFEDGDLGDEAIGRTLAALEAPGGDPALSGVLRGHVAINAAWKARGGGWANSVTEKGWQGFRAGLAEARQALTAAWQALPESASAASLMITVTMGDGSGEAQLWFDRAIAADPGCPDAWKRMSNALRPRWGGSTQQLLALAQRAVADARPGNRLAGAAQHVLFVYVDDDGDEAAAWAEIARLDATCPPQPGPGQTFRAMGVAWYAGRKAQALELFAQLGGTAAPAAALDAAPFGLRRGMRLISTIERARLGQATPRIRAIPADGTPHRKALHAPSYLALLPAWWQKHGAHEPAWDARIAALLEKRANAATAPALDLVTAGCRDPLVRYLAWDEQSDRPRTERRAELLACWNELEAAGYPPVVIWQPAWFLMRDLYQDKGATAERAAQLPRFAALAARLALSMGDNGVDGGLVLYELGDPPAQDPALLELIEQAATTRGVEPALASGLTGLIALARAQRMNQNDRQRVRLAWTALGRLWPAWNAYRHPKAAAAMCTAACIANLPDEGRLWFDEAVRLAYDDNLPWSAMIDGYALTGSPDELIAFANEIAALPASSGAAMRALAPVHSVLRNRWLYNPQRLKMAWKAIDRATATCLADPAIVAGMRSQLLYWRIAGAALAEDQPAVTAALTALAAPYDPKHLPAGIDPAKIEPAVTAASPEPLSKPVDF